MIDGERGGGETKPPIGAKRIVLCTLHGLHFDSSIASGCVLCRRTSLPPPGDGARGKLVLGAAAGALVLLVVTGSFALWRRHRTAGTALAQSSAMVAPSPAPTFNALTPPGARRQPSPDPRHRYGANPFSDEEAREALVRIASARTSCSAGDEDGCIRFATACVPFEYAGGARPGMLLPVAQPEVRLELRDACRGALQTVRQRCDGGSLTACDAALVSGLFPNPGQPWLERVCDLGSARACRQLVQVLPAESAGREAAGMRADVLDKCTAQPQAPCVAPSREQLAGAAVDHLKRQAMEKCRSGTVEDCKRYAEVYAHGESPDLTLSAKLTEEGCNRGDPSACSRLSSILAEGRGVPRDPRRALELHDRGMAGAVKALEECKSDDYACAMLQLAYAKGRGDLREQLQRAEMAPDEVAKECTAGKLGACDALRGAYSGGASRLAPDPAKAALYGTQANQLLEQSCQAGDRDACKALAKNLLYAQPLDIPRGKKLADQACASGGYLDCWMLGEFLDYGSAGHDPATAAAYYARAVTAATPLCGGDVGACELLAQAYYRGKGVTRSEKKYDEYALKLVELTRAK